MYTSESLLKAIKEAREEAGLTQKEVEAQLEMRPLTMRDYEVGRLKLPLSVAIDLADLYGVTLDQLSGRGVPLFQQSPSQFMANFTSLFSVSSPQLILVDPVLRAFFEDHRDEFFDKSMFEVLVSGLNVRDRKSLLHDVTKLLFSLASCDGKVSSEEIKTIKYILAKNDLVKSYKNVSVFGGREFRFSKIPKYLESRELRHFLVWILFLFANTNQEVSSVEVSFIEKRSEELRVNRSNFLFIREHFYQEKI